MADLDKDSPGNRGPDGFIESPYWFVIPCRILYQLYSIFFPILGVKIMEKETTINSRYL